LKTPALDPYVCCAFILCSSFGERIKWIGFKVSLCLRCRFVVQCSSTCVMCIRDCILYLTAMYIFAFRRSRVRSPRWTPTVLSRIIMVLLSKFRQIPEQITVLRYYAVLSGNSVPAFRDNLWVPSSDEVKNEWSYTSVPLMHFHGVNRNGFAFVTFTSSMNFIRTH
jgi:hypothetical protein